MGVYTTICTLFMCFLAMKIIKNVTYSVSNFGVVKFRGVGTGEAGEAAASPEIKGWQTNFLGKSAKKLAIFEVASPEIILFLHPCQKQRAYELLWMLWFDEKSISIVHRDKKSGNAVTTCKHIFWLVYWDDFATRTWFFFCTDSIYFWSTKYYSKDWNY